MIANIDCNMSDVFDELKTWVNKLYRNWATSNWTLKCKTHIEVQNTHWSAKYALKCKIHIEVQMTNKETTVYKEHRIVHNE